MRLLKRLERRTESGTVSEIAEVELGQKEVEMEEVGHRVQDAEQLDPVVVDNGRMEEMDYMVETRGRFDFARGNEQGRNAFLQERPGSTT